MNPSPARSYETPAVVYEAKLLAHAGSSPASTLGCGCARPSATCLTRTRGTSTVWSDFRSRPDSHPASPLVAGMGV